MKFTTKLELGGKTATGFVVPPEVVEALGKGKKPPVKVTINGYTYRNTVAVYGGVYMLGVSAEHREGAGVEAGEVIEVDLELDTEPRVLEIPADLTEALERVPEAKAYFESLSYSNKRRHVLAIEGAKAAETRQRRIEKSVGMFKEGKN